MRSDMFWIQNPGSYVFFVVIVSVSVMMWTNLSAKSEVNG